MSVSFMGDSIKEKLIFFTVFGVIVAALLFPSVQLSRLQEFMIAQNQQIIDNSNRNYLAVVNQSKAGVVRTAILLHDNQRIVQNLTTQLKDRQDVDDKVLHAFVASNDANNKTMTKLGGFENLIHDIHNARIQAEHNTDLLNKTLNRVQSLEYTLPSKENNKLLHQILDIITTHSANPKTVQLFQPQASGTISSSNANNNMTMSNNNNSTNTTRAK